MQEGSLLPIVIGLMIMAGCTDIDAAELIVGRAVAIDGDTIEIEGEEIRLHGIDAVERWQMCRDKDWIQYSCGNEAAFLLADFLERSPPLSCDVVARDRQGRVAANCRRADGASVNAWMVEQGYALDRARYSGGAYSSLQKQAREAHRGLWKGQFDAPCVARATRESRPPVC